MRFVAVRHIFVLMVVLLSPRLAEARPIMALLSVEYAITGTGIEWDGTKIGGPDECWCPLYTVTIDETSNSPLFAVESFWTFYMMAEASGSMDSSGGHLYAFGMESTEGTSSVDSLTAKSQATFVSLVSQLELSLFTKHGGNGGHDVTLYDETLGEHVFQMLSSNSPYPFDPGPFHVNAHVGHVYTLTSYAHGYFGFGRDAGVTITGTPVSEVGSTFLLLVTAIAAVAMIRMSHLLH